ncbi:MAG: hypothetical protein UH850_14870 [Paludibacteraceae bacterium]|nr:hypothetical protein [Paludibacteraceae bacterium]
MGASPFDWRPMECKEYVVPELKIPEVRSRACTKKTLGKVLAFIDMVKYKRLAHGCTIMPIATTNKKFISICGSKMNASRMIKSMINIGLLEEEDITFQFGANQEGYNKSRTYRYYYDNEQKLIKYCKENNINKYVVVNNIYSTVCNKFKIENFDHQKVRFSSQLHLLKPDNYSVTQFENYITGVLYQNYPYLAHYQDLADEINAKYYADCPEMAINFTPNYTWNKGNKAITKIGIRATNELVSAKKDKDGNENFYGVYKEDVLEQYGLDLEKDVTSSIPRITLSLNKGEWIPEEVDIYEKIYQEYINIHTVCNKFAEVRSAIKKLHMRAYFDRPSTLGVHTRRVMANVRDKEAVDAEMRVYQEAVIKAEGGRLLGSEAFYVESCIYMDVLKQLLNDGYMVWQCYDAFYASKEGITQEYFEKHVTKVVEEKANLYIHTVVQKFNIAVNQ